MSTLAEIESAVRTLPRQEQEILLRHLSQELAPRPPAIVRIEHRKEWLDRLAKLRARTRNVGAGVQEIFDDLRGGR